jgi:hypothetical protein
MSIYRAIEVMGFVVVLVTAASSLAEPLKKNPTPQDYVETNGGGATVVPAGQLLLDGHRMTCGNWATVLDPNLNDYAAAPYPQFVVLNMPYQPRRKLGWVAAYDP